MWTFSSMSSKTFGFPPGVWCCQRHRAQNLPGGQNVRFIAYQLFSSMSMSVSPACCLFFFFCLVSHCSFFPLIAIITRPLSLCGELNASMFSVCLSSTFFSFVGSLGPFHFFFFVVSQVCRLKLMWKEVMSKCVAVSVSTLSVSAHS